MPAVPGASASTSSISSMESPARVVIGRVTRAHALAGGVRVRPDGPTVANLAPGDRVEAVGPGGTSRALTVAERAGDAASPILRFREITDRNGAEELRNALLQVADEAIDADLDAGTYFVRDLIGCTVFSGDRELGAIIDVHAGTANDNLEIEGSDGPLLVPFTHDAVTAIEPDARRVVIRPDLLGDVRDED